MIGIIIELLISWLLLKYIGKRDLSVLGLVPTIPRIRDFMLGLLWPIFFFCLFKFLIAQLVDNPYHVNESYGLMDFFVSLVYVTKAVLYEELIFRGAVLYVLIQRMGQNRGVLISSLAFGIYHWFSWQVFGNPIQMLTVLFMTGSIGYILSSAYVKTGSMYLPIALHLGANMTNMIIFSQDQAIGLQLLEKTYAVDPHIPNAIISIPIIFIHFAGYQLLTVLWLWKFRSVMGH